MVLCVPSCPECPTLSHGNTTIAINLCSGSKQLFNHQFSRPWQLNKINIIMNINHNNVPEALGILIEKVDFLTSQLAGLSKTEKTDVRNLDMDDLIAFLHKKGLKISKSKIYKLCMNRRIPFLKFGNRSVFRMQDIEQWIESNCKSVQQDDSESVRAVVRSAQKKERRSDYGK